MVYVVFLYSVLVIGIKSYQNDKMVGNMVDKTIIYKVAVKVNDKSMWNIIISRFNVFLLLIYRSIIWKTFFYHFYKDINRLLLIETWGNIVSIFLIYCKFIFIFTDFVYSSYSNVVVDRNGFFCTVVNILENTCDSSCRTTCLFSYTWRHQNHQSSISWHVSFVEHYKVSYADNDRDEYWKVRSSDGSENSSCTFLLFVFKFHY